MWPILFRLPGLGWPIYSYGVMLGLSLIVGWSVSLGLAERDGLPRERLASCYVWTAIAAVLGARLLYVLTNLDRFSELSDVFRVRDGGLVAYGGFLAGLGVSWLYCRARRIPFLAWGDCAVPALGTGLFFTRIGCLLYGCDYGRPTRSALAVTFPGPWRLAPGGSPAYQLQLAQGLLGPGAARSLPVHPTQIYESLLGLALFGVLLLVRRWRRFSGEMLLCFGALYGIGRFLLEYLRGDDQRGTLGPFSTSQIIGLVLVPVCVLAYVLLWRRWRRDPAGTRIWTQGVAVRLAAEAAPAAPAGRARRRRSSR